MNARDTAMPGMMPGAPAMPGNDARMPTCLEMMPEPRAWNSVMPNARDGWNAQMPGMETPEFASTRSLSQSN